LYLEINAGLDAGEGLRMNIKDSHGSRKNGFFLSERPYESFAAGEWIYQLVALGSRLSKYINFVESEQVIVVISVPSREFVAALIAYGWVLEKPVRPRMLPLEVIRLAQPGEIVRLVNKEEVVCGRFDRIDCLKESGTGARVIVSGHKWAVERLSAAAIVANAPVGDGELRRKKLHLLRNNLSAVDDNDRWDRWLATMSEDIAIIGPKKRLNADLEVSLLRSETDDVSAGAIRRVVIPNEPDAAVWNTGIFSPSNLSEDSAIIGQKQLVILDGSEAISLLEDVSSPLVVCIFDRQKPHQWACDYLRAQKAYSCELIDLAEKVRWTPLPGIEATAFRVKL
jgi:hypothetical protein